MSDALTKSLADLEAARQQQTQAAPGAPSVTPRPDERSAPPAAKAQPETSGAGSPFDILRQGLQLTPTIMGMMAKPALKAVSRNPTMPLVGLASEAADTGLSVAAARGAVKGVNETTDLAAEVGTKIGEGLGSNEDVLNFLDPRKQDVGGAVGRGLISFSKATSKIGFGRNEAPNIPLPGGPTPEDAGLAERAVEGVSQAVTGYLIGGRVLKMLKVGEGANLAQKFLRASAQGAIGDYVAFDGNDERLSNLVESVPALRNPITGYLSADISDDELEGRLKNVLEGAGFGATVGLALESTVKALASVLRGTKALRSGDTAAAQAAADALERQVSAGATTQKVASETAQAAQVAQKKAAAEVPQPGLITRVMDTVRQRLGLKASSTASKELDEAGAIAALRKEAATRASAEVNVSGLSPRDAEDARSAAGHNAADAAEQEFRRLQAEQPAEGAKPAAQAESAAPGAKATAPEAPEIPEGVLSSKADVEGLLKEIEFNRNFSGDLNIKPGSEDALTKQHGEWTLNTFGSPEKLDATLRALVERTATKATKSDETLHAGAIAAANDLGQTPEDALIAGAHIAGIAGNIDDAVQTMRVLWKRSTSEVDAHVGKNVGEMTDDEYANLVRSIHNALTFSNYMAQVKSAMGRGLRVFQLPDADTFAKAVAEGGDNAAPPRELALPTDRQGVSDWLELWGLTRDNPAARSAFLEGQQALPNQWKYLRNSFANLFTANILSGLTSISLNVVGPAMIGALRTIEKTTGGYMASLLPWIPRARRAELASSASNAMVAYAQAMGDIGDVFKYAKQSVVEGRSILGGGGSVTERAGQFGPITEGMLRATGQEGGLGYWGGNIVNIWPSAFSRVNNGLDEFSKRLSYLGEARARALVEGGTQGLTGDDLRAFVRDRVSKSTDEVGAAMDDEVLKAAEKTTFTGSPGAEGTKARALSNLINDWRANTPEIRYVLPIFNVPANALGETLTRIPVFNTLLKETREELMGAHGAVRQAEAHGRMLLGAAFLTAGFYLARSGQLTGAGPDSPTDRKVWSMTHQPYSIRIGDKWVDYSRYDIAGSLLGIPATVFDKTVNRRQDLGAIEMMTASAAALSQFFRDRAALQTASDILSFGESGQSPQAFIDRLGGGVAGRMLMPNWVTQLGRQAAGNTEATTKTTMWSNALDLMPFAAGSLDPQRNVWGEPIHRPKDTFFENIAPITITPASVYAKDPQTDELDRLYGTTGYAAGVTAQDDVSGGFYDAREVKLEDGHSLYDAIIRARNTVDIDGLTLRKAMQELMDSSDYADAVDADASNRYTSNGDTSRGYLISQVFRQYHEAAKQQVAQQSDRAAKYLAATAAKRTDDATLRNYSAEELINTRGLADALGIDLEGYMARARGE